MFVFMHQTWKNDIPELKEVETAYLHAPPSLDVAQPTRETTSSPSLQPLLN